LHGRLPDVDVNPTHHRGNTMAGKDQVPKDFRRVVVAAAVGNVI
jgi:hypothetical protein